MGIKASLASPESKPQHVSLGLKTAQHGAPLAQPAGPDAAAMAPPAYGMDVLDRASGEPAFALQRQAAPPTGTAQMRAALSSAGDESRARQENRTGLPDDLKAGVESLSGLSLGDVRVHYNSPEPAQLQALAYTQGNQIYVGPGQERHLPHESWHVVQQKQGRVQPTIQAKGVAINDDQGLEREANVMGALAWRLGGPGLSAATMVSESTTTIQRQAAVLGLAHSAPSGRNVVQLATNLRFEADVTGNSTIVATQHNRTGVHALAANWVLTNGAWGSVPDNEVCNHSRDYDQIAQQILDSIHNGTLSDAADTVKTSYGTLQGKNQGLGAAMSTHRGRIDNIIDNPDDAVDTDDTIDTFNYYIYKICDYPRNLFFWPDKTGNEPDLPKGEYGENNVMDSDWKVNNDLISNKTRLSREKKRLQDGRGDISEAMPDDAD